MGEIKWECPKCKAPANEHGEGGAEWCRQCAEWCRQLGGGHCGGFLCECSVDEKDHGESQDKPCLEALCYHCGWGGRFPPLPQKLKPYEKQALAAGWMPPKGWIGS